MDYSGLAELIQDSHFNFIKKDNLSLTDSYGLLADFQLVERQSNLKQIQLTENRLKDSRMEF